MNYGYDSLNCFIPILCGEPHLNNTLCKPVHEVLCQRITVHCDFSGLSDTEMPPYVCHKISIYGGPPSIMTDALTIGTQMNLSVIDPDVILVAITNQILE